MGQYRDICRPGEETCQLGTKVQPRLDELFNIGAPLGFCQVSRNQSERKIKPANHGWGYYMPAPLLTKSEMTTQSLWWCQSYIFLSDHGSESLSTIKGLILYLVFDLFFSYMQGRYPPLPLPLFFWNLYIANVEDAQLCHDCCNT